MCIEGRMANAVENDYSPSRWAKRMGANEVIMNHVQVTTDISRKNRENIVCTVHRVPGSGGEQVELFGSSLLPRNSPIFVYVSGGYWSELSGGISAYTARPMFEAGIVNAVVHYDRAPGVSLTEIVQQVRNCLAWVLAYASDNYVESVTLCGHSAGAHLITMALSTPDPLPNSRLITAVYHMAGVYDLVPLLNTYIAEPLRLGHEEAEANSPVSAMNVDAYCKATASAMTRVIMGEHECPGLRRQNQQWAELLRSHGMHVQLTVLPGVDHFNLIEAFANGDDRVTKEAIAVCKRLDVNNSCLAKKS